MEQTKLDFIYLLSCFLNGTVPENKVYDWETIYHYADINDVAGIIAFLIKALDDEYKPSGELLMYFKKSMAVAISSYEEKSSAYSYISALLEENDIDYITVKGMIVREYYPVRELRTSGDVDFIIKENQLEKAYKALQLPQIEIKAYNAGVIVLSACDSMVEIHNSADVKSEYFKNVFSRVKSGEHTLNDYDHLLYVLCHLLKHMSYRGAGIRMLMDLDVMIKSFASFDEKYFIKLCDEAGVLKGAQVLLSLSRLWFDTPVSSYYDLSNDSALLQKLSDVFINGGSFGYEMSFVPAGYVKNSIGKDGRISFINRIRIALRMAFPKKEYLKKCYKYYEKHSALYPLAVINRLYDSLFKKRKNARGAIKQIFNNPSSAVLQQEIIKELEILD